MHERNRHLADNSSACICYLTEKTGGTSYTAEYAKRKKLLVINAAEKKRAFFSPQNHRLFRKVYNLKSHTLRQISCKMIHDVARFVNTYGEKVKWYFILDCFVVNFTQKC